MPRVDIYHCDTLLGTVCIGSEPVTIGRSPENVIFTEDPGVSRRHCRVKFHGASCFVEDLNSSNGTYVNSTRLTCKQELEETDTLTVRKYHFVFHCGDADAGASGPSVVFVKAGGGVTVDKSQLHVRGERATQEEEDDPGMITIRFKALKGDFNPLRPAAAVPVPVPATRYREGIFSTLIATAAVYAGVHLFFSDNSAMAVAVVAGGILAALLLLTRSRVHVYCLLLGSWLGRHWRPLAFVVLLGLIEFAVWLLLLDWRIVALSASHVFLGLLAACWFTRPHNTA
jgi:pSer/pThr/pTyr-binding forkhead associated (FHA) protein